MDREQGREKVAGLAAAFKDKIGLYKAEAYNENQVRRDFIDPLFEALGWDIGNLLRLPEHQRQVLLETRLIEDERKYPDYTFRNGKERAFFVEAKKPAVNIKNDYHPAYQTRSYGWSAQIPCILTDFEEFAVYHYASKPERQDKPAVARILYLTYEEYASRWDELYEQFSWEAVTGGSLGRLMEGYKSARGTETVDAQFLREIEGWRVQLAKSIALLNPQLNQRDLNRMVQLSIDRIIFLRIAEDRSIEPYKQLWEAAQNTRDEGAIYAQLTRLFSQADDKYNSGLFHFKPESGRGDDFDQLSLHIKIDNQTLKDIIHNLYFPNRPYRFAVMPAEILGNVYEQFLGKVILLSESGKAEVAEKPEIRKAGGVYYTPSYIVDYIVANTVGKLLPNPKLKILDPACGSGSFLIGAYQYLLDWYLGFYTREPKKHIKKLYPLPDGSYQLAIEERKRILLEHIYGVDIDLQAVEVTKLSLLLKVLEGETSQTIGQITMFKERVLPDLSHNIKCGNSLIGTDYLEARQMSLFEMDEEERYRVNMFDWESHFPQIMKSGGFDAVIGNPPYVRIQTLREWASEEVDFYNKSYLAAGAGSYDIYVLFVEKGLQLLSSKGLLGFILPHKFFNAKYGAPLRGLIAQGQHLNEIVHFGDQQVFANATTYTCLLFLNKSRSHKTFLFSKVKDLHAFQEANYTIMGEIENSSVTNNEWNFAVGNEDKLLDRLALNPRLGDIANIFVGLQTSADKVFILEKLDENIDDINLKSKSLLKIVSLEREILHPLISGIDAKRYAPLPKRQFILFPYDVAYPKATLLPYEKISSYFPQAGQYLEENRQTLEKREKGKFTDTQWYRFGRSQNLGIQEQPKICVPRLVKPLHATIDLNGDYYLDNVDVGGVTFKEEFQGTSLLYLLGLINSHLLGWYFPFISAPFRGGYLSANRQFLSQLPIRVIDFSKPDEVAMHNKMVKLVETMLEYQRRLPTLEGEIKKQAEMVIARTDREIDQLVYALYGLTAEEIALVEA